MSQRAPGKQKATKSRSARLDWQRLLGLLVWAASVGLFLAGASLILKRKPGRTQMAAQPAPLRMDGGVAEPEPEQRR